MKRSVEVALATGAVIGMAGLTVGMGELVIKNVLISDFSVDDHAAVTAAHFEALQPGDSQSVAAAVVIADPGTVFRTSPAEIDPDNPESAPSNRAIEAPRLQTDLSPLRLSHIVPAGTFSEAVALWRPAGTETIQYSKATACYIGSLANPYGSLWARYDGSTNPGIHVYRRMVDGVFPDSMQPVKLIAKQSDDGSFTFKSGQSNATAMGFKLVENVKTFTEGLERQGYREVDPSLLTPCAN